jgi:hypothetical protein
MLKEPQLMIKTNSDATIGMVSMCIQHVTWQNYGCLVIISNTEKPQMVIPVLTITALNWGTSSGRSNVSYTKWRLFAKSKFIRYKENNILLILCFRWGQKKYSLNTHFTKYGNTK